MSRYMLKYSILGILLSALVILSYPLVFKPCDYDYRIPISNVDLAGVCINKAITSTGASS